VKKRMVSCSPDWWRDFSKQRVANAAPGDEQTIRAEIKRYFYDAGDPGSAAALNSALSAVLRPGITQSDRQRILNNLDVYTRVDPKEYAGVRDWTTGAALVAGTVPPGAAGEAESGEAASAGTTAEAATAVSSSEAWKWGWARRGIYFSEQLGANLPPNFPGIDSWLNGIATSIKSIDLTAATYQDTGRLTYRLNSYIDSIASYQGGKLATLTINSASISGRALSIAIPKGTTTAVQQAAIDAARARANAFDVDFTVTGF
jgi:hypothetical protein